MTIQEDRLKRISKLIKTLFFVLDDLDTLPEATWDSLSTACIAMAVHAKPDRRVKPVQALLLEIYPREEVLPLWLPLEQWKAFVAMRARMKAPMTDRGKQLAIAELAKLAHVGNDPADVLDQSIMFGYKGLFALKTAWNDTMRKTAAQKRQDDNDQSENFVRQAIEAGLDYATLKEMSGISPVHHATGNDGVARPAERVQSLPDQLSIGRSLERGAE